MNPSSIILTAVLINISIAVFYLSIYLNYVEYDYENIS